jgi:putative membrane protein
MGFFGMGFTWIIGVILLAAIIWFVARPQNQVNETNQHSPKTALDILKDRYARGEIDKYEFQERKSDLMR